MKDSFIIKDVLKDAVSFLKQTSATTPYLDAQLLLAHVLNCDRVALYTNENKNIFSLHYKRFIKLLHKRGEGQPIQYLIGRAEFYDISFYVDKNVLIPRPDTEILVSNVIDCIKNNSFSNILEIGTGSGCISIAIAKNCNINVTATDISKKSLAVAKKNAISNDISEKITFLESNLFRNIPNDVTNNADIIISNPPYIKTDEIPNSLKYEPIRALNGGEDGLYFYKKIAKLCSRKMRLGGFLFLEIGYNQKEEVIEILCNNGFINPVCIKDFAGHDRVIKVELK